MKKYQLLFIFYCVVTCTVSAQQTFPVNGVQDYREGYIAFTHATIVKDSKTVLKDAKKQIKAHAAARVAVVQKYIIL